MTNNDSIPALSGVQAALLNKLSSNGDVRISTLFVMLKKRRPAPHETLRRQQQAISMVITRTNRKLKAHRMRVVPGVRRGTYRLIHL